MKRKFLILTVTVLLLSVLLGVSSQADDYYDIRHFDVKIDVNEDNTYNITETITVEFYQPRHGIFRDIPFKRDRLNHGVTDISVINPDTGQKETIDISNVEAVKRIRIGDADIYVEGFKTYQIRYLYDWGYDYNDEMDEFYFNIIGNRWNANIDKVTFSITMPKAFDRNAVSFTTGNYGNTTNDNVTYSIEGNTITGESIQPFYKEFITIALPLEEGYYSAATKPSFLPLFLFAALIIGIAVFAFIKNRRFKQKDHIIPVVQFQPPSGFSPAEVAYIYNREQLNSYDTSTLILSWASLGCLKIEEDPKKKNKMTMTKLKELPEGRPNYEVSLFKSMFRHGTGGIVTTKDLKNYFYKDLTAAEFSVKQKFSGDKEILVNKVQWQGKWYAFLYMVAFVLLNALVAGYMMNQLRFPDIMFYIIPPFIASLFILVGLSLTAGIFYKKSTTKRKIITGIIVLLLYFVLSSAYNTLFRDFTYIVNMGTVTGFTLFAVKVAYLLGIWFMVSSRLYTPYANDVLGYIEGFREFIRTAKKDQIELIYNENPDYVYDILPYAMVLDLTKIWEKHATALSVPAPEWYVSERNFTPHVFTGAMAASFAAASTSPNSSGSTSSSGGSSGGGGGGGGGGSW